MTRAANTRHPRGVGYTEDIDRLRDYVRSTGRADYRRMRELSSEVVQVEFIVNVEQHAAAIARLLDDPEHVRVIEANSGLDHSERVQRYWEPIREQIAAQSDDEAITELAFGHDDAGPLIFVGVYPFTAEVAARMAERFAPHRVRVHERPPVTPASGGQPIVL
jgi:hypothetical protein